MKKEDLGPTLTNWWWLVEQALMVKSMNQGEDEE
jgi:hypothetical protein